MRLSPYLDSRSEAGLRLSDTYLGDRPARPTHGIVNQLDPRDLMAIARSVFARSSRAVHRSFVLYAARPARVSVRNITTVRIPRVKRSA